MREIAFQEQFIASEDREEECTDESSLDRTIKIISGPLELTPINPLAQFLPSHRLRTEQDDRSASRSRGRHKSNSSTERQKSGPSSGMVRVQVATRPRNTVTGTTGRLSGNRKNEISKNFSNESLENLEQKQGLKVWMPRQFYSELSSSSHQLDIVERLVKAAANTRQKF